MHLPHIGFLPFHNSQNHPLFPALYVHASAQSAHFLHVIHFDKSKVAGTRQKGVLVFDPWPVGAHDAWRLLKPEILIKQIYTTKQTDNSSANNCAVNDKRPYKGMTRNSELVLTVHRKNVTGLGPMAWRLSLSTLDEGRQTGSPLVPYKLPRLLPHKGRVPGRSRDSPSWTQLLTVQLLAARQGGDGEKTGTPFPGSVCPLLEYGWCRSPMQIRSTPVCLCLSCINGAWVLQRSKKCISK